MNIGEELIIGRMGQQPMPIVNPSVDPSHAILRKTAEGVYQIEDNGSAQGIFVYGMRVKRKTVNENTPILLGQFSTTVQQLLQDPRAINLGAIWNKYEEEKRRWDRRTMMVNYLRVLPGILTMLLSMFVGPDMPNNKRALITIVLTVAVLIISMIAGDRIMAKKNLRMSELASEMKQKYVCPYCQRPLPLTPYKVLKQNVFCPYNDCNKPI